MADEDEPVEKKMEEMDRMLWDMDPTEEQILEYLGHDDPAVRHRAAELLWDYPQKQYTDSLLTLANQDPSEEVRTRALHTLGAFVDWGEFHDYEYDEEERFGSQWGDPNALTEEQYREIKTFLLECIEHEEKSRDERRAALEAVSFSSDSRVEQALEEAYNRDHPDWVISALFGMGRHGHSKWESLVLDNLHHENIDVQREAIRAAAKLYLEDANRALMDISETTEDEDLRREALLALGQIGSNKGNAMDYLEELELSHSGEFGEFVGEVVSEWHLQYRMRHEDLGEDPPI